MACHVHPKKLKNPEYSCSGRLENVHERIENKTGPIQMEVEEHQHQQRDTLYDLASSQDLTKLRTLSAPAVLHCLECRYEQDFFYTRAGQTLVAVNPFKDIQGLYGQAEIKRYHSVDTSQPALWFSCDCLPPHVYAVAEQAYRNLNYCLGHINQSVIVSGESGAGKTVSAKHLMKYLVTVSTQASDRETGVGSHVEQRILDSNPVLEAFGNAATLRNHNSSRFGKYIQLQFDRTGSICGACIHTYLLEKTRVVQQADGEFNFHIFYQMLNGCTEKEGSKWGLTGTTCADHSSYNADRAAWLATRNALNDLGLSDTDQDNLFTLISSLLHLGNVRFVVDEDDDTACSCDTDNLASCASLQTCCHLLGLDDTDLEHAMTYRKITASHSKRKSVFHKPCSVAESVSRRNCLAKLLYAKLFEWLVAFINKSIYAEGSYHTIGLLDIYGFESFQENSLEQLCINYANEKLQQHFVTHFLRELQEDYRREAIEWVDTDFTDNRPCLDLLEGNPSVFSLLNEECQLNRSSDTVALAERLKSELAEKPGLGRGRGQVRSALFTVVHYAGSIPYTTEGMLEKNKDNVPEELVTLLQRSQNEFVANLFCDYEFDGGTKKKKTVLSKFKVSLDSLMTTLNKTDPHYIRCIKPNVHCRPEEFDSAYILAQLEACGVMESVDICRKGYPVRIPYEEFLPRYSLLLSCPVRGKVEEGCHDNNKENELLYEPLDMLYQQQLQLTPRRRSCTPRKKLRRRAGWSSGDHCRRLCASILKVAFGMTELRGPKPTLQFGKTKIFLTDVQLEKLESRRTAQRTKHAFTIQCAWRRYKRWKCLQSVIRIQTAVRGWLQRRETAARQIQLWYHNVSQHRQLKNSKTGDVTQAVRDTCDSSVDTAASTVSEKAGLCKAHGTDGLESQGHEIANQLTFAGGTETQKEREILTGHHHGPGVEASLRECAATIMAAVLEQKKFQLSGPLAGIMYLEAQEGLLSRRRMPRVKIRFHTRANHLLKCAHYIHQKEFQCSLTDCLQKYD